MKREAGFTLIEILIVLAIISTLMAGVMIIIPIVQDRSKKTMTSNLITQAAAQLSMVKSSSNLGEYPPTNTSDLRIGRTRIGKEIGTPNDINVGGETLALVVFMKNLSLGSRLGTECLMNVDGDMALKNFTIHKKPDLFEIQDAYGNPLIYIHYRDYDVAAAGNWLYRFITEDDEEDLVVKPWKNPKTGNYFNLESFQIFSAGLDGIPNTEDDIANFAVPRE